MAQAELLGDGRIAVSTTYAEKDLIKSVPGSRWDAGLKAWTVPQSFAICRALRGVFPKIELGPQLRAWAWEERLNRVDPAKELREALEAEGPEHLYPFQRAGVRFLATARQALLCDEMGTGKTIQTITTVRTLVDQGEAAFPVCVVAPNSVKLTWLNEWAKFDRNGVRVIVIHGGVAKKRKQFAEAEEAIANGEEVVVVINWEAVRLHSRMAPYGSIALKRCSDCGGQDETLTIAKCEVHPKELNALPFRTVVVDEAHRMKEPKSKQTRAVWAVQHQPSVEFRYSLTGTPIANHLGEAWSLLHGIAPSDFPQKTKYVDRYCLQSWNTFGGLDIIGVRPDTRDEYFDIVDPRMRRMSKDLVLPFLPRKTRQLRYVEMKPKQAKAYRDIEEGMITRLDDGSIVMATNNLAQNTRLLQFSSSYAELTAEGNVRLSEPSPKLDAMDEILDELGQEPVVVAAESKQLIELAAVRLEKAGVTFRKIVGGMTAEERQRAIDDFQGGHARVMLMTLKAGGVGLTLTRAGVIVFLQRSWSMIDNKQGEDRVHRIGSEIHDKIVVIDLVTQGTIEETQIPKLHAKLARLEELVRDREALARAGRTQELADLDLAIATIETAPLWDGAPNPNQEVVA